MRLSYYIFIIHFIIRFIYSLYSGFYNNYTLQADSKWLVQFADLTLNTHSFNYTLDRFIASPLYIVICATFKAIFGEAWNTALIFFQISLSALSGVYIFKITKLIFTPPQIALLAALLHAFFPQTLWFVHTFSQENIFQCLLIFSIYYLLKSINTPTTKTVFIASILFSATYLTKSHILLFSIFIPLIYFHAFKYSSKTVAYTLIFAGVSLACSVPYGLYHKQLQQVYVISSNGAGYQFYLGNTEAGYKTVVEVPPQNSADYKTLKNINITAGYFNGNPAQYQNLLSMPQSQKQQLFVQEAITWIKNNPIKFFWLKIYDFLFFMLPGVSYRHYSFNNWLFSFLISTPIYVAAYIGIYKNLKINFLKHNFIFYIFISMLLFSVVWYVQNRFRTITLEPFYLIYAAYFFYTYFIPKKLGFFKN